MQQLTDSQLRFLEHVYANLFHPVKIRLNSPPPWFSELNESVLSDLGLIQTKLVGVDGEAEYWIWHVQSKWQEVKRLFTPGPATDEQPPTGKVENHSLEIVSEKKPTIPKQLAGLCESLKGYYSPRQFEQAGLSDIMPNRNPSNVRQQLYKAQRYTDNVQIEPHLDGGVTISPIGL